LLHRADEFLERLPAQIAQPLNYTWAITLSLLAVPILGQRMSWRAASGLLVSYCGVVVLLSQWRIRKTTRSTVRYRT
jgi:drug/metabolite transporter (DMT)-like permease